MLVGRCMDATHENETEVHRMREKMRRRNEVLWMALRDDALSTQFELLNALLERQYKFTEKPNNLQEKQIRPDNLHIG